MDHLCIGLMRGYSCGVSVWMVISRPRCWSVDESSVRFVSGLWMFGLMA